MIETAAQHRGDPGVPREQEAHYPTPGRARGAGESVAEENVVQEQLRTTADYREGFAAFQQKRKATFDGN